MFLSTHFHKKLEQRSGLRLKLKINDNRSTMLSVRWDPDYTRVSLHRMFLNAPNNVMNALACYLRQEDKMITLPIKSFIEKNVKKLDYSYLIDQSRLSTQGSVYDLKKIYDELNDEYFSGKLNLFITWFGKPTPRRRNRVIFGLYQEPLRLVKIHRLLDSPSFPDYVVSYVVYHEMLHHVCPSYHDQNGTHRIHTKEFKQREAKFKHFALAQQWLKDHQGHLFKGMF